MKLTTFFLAVGVAASSARLFAAEGSVNLTDPKERLSYALGVNFGQNMKNNGIEANLEVVRKGIDDALAGKPQLNNTELNETFTQFRKQMMEEKKKQGDQFLAENAKKPGIEKTDSGLQYRVIEPGSGASPNTNDQVVVKYTGKLIDGTVFDSSDKLPGGTNKFHVNGVIRGWTEGLLKMKKGAKWELFIPSGLAYGERARPNIPANSALIFTVELVDILPTTPPPSPIAQQPVTSDIIKVPSAEELKKGAKIEVIKPEDVEKEIAKEKARKEAEEKAAKKP